MKSTKLRSTKSKKSNTINLVMMFLNKEVVSALAALKVVPVALAAKSEVPATLPVIPPAVRPAADVNNKVSKKATIRAKTLTPFPKT